MKKQTAVVMAVVAGFASAPLSANAGPAVTPLVSTEWLDDNLGAADLVIIDYRPETAFVESHVPGALRTDYPGLWRTTRDDVPWVLPDVAELESFLSGLGIDAETSVVVVPAGAGATELGGATWIYWVLKYLGHDAVAVLDGGFAAWTGEGRETEAGPAHAPDGRSFVADLQPGILADTGYVADHLGGAAVIVDARPAAQYTGEATSGLVTRAGHIPGAINLDNALLFDTERGRLKPVDQLEAVLPAALADRSQAVIAYCNTGHWSSINWFVLHELLGFTDIRLYEGSIAAWSRTDLPLSLGGGP